MRRLIAPECSQCLRRLAAQCLAARGRAGEGDFWDGLERDIDQGLAQGETPALIASRFMAEIARVTGEPDPFAAKKAADQAAAQAAVAAMPPWPDTFNARARAAILGNALDHFLAPDAEGFWRGGKGLELGVDHLALAEARLFPGALVVMLSDNTGEQCFDRLLVEHLLGRGCRVVYAVKSAPVQNDLWLGDLKAMGQDHGLGEVIETGRAGVGLDPADVPGPLAELLARADLVIAKGMGHFETLAMAPAEQTPWPLLMLFLAKCQPVADCLGVEKGQGAALFRDRGRAV